MSNVAPLPVLAMFVPAIFEYVCVPPGLSAVSWPVKLTVVPVMPLTKIAVPVPLLIAKPSTIPVASATSITVSPVTALVPMFVVTTSPPLPTVPVTWVPDEMPDPDKGVPIGGTLSTAI